jgi:hypothetical protein
MADHPNHIVSRLRVSGARQLLLYLQTQLFKNLKFEKCKSNN